RPEREGDNRETRGDRPPRRRDQPADRGPRRDRPSFGPRPAEARGRAPGDRRPPQRGGARRGEPRGDFERKAPAPPPLPELNCTYIPDDRGVESLAKQIKMTGRAYPLFEI